MNSGLSQNWFGCPLLWILFVVPNLLWSQPSPSSLADIVFLDSVVVRASRDAFSVADFIAMVQEDNTFYEAFQNLRRVGYRFATDMEFYDRKSRVAGTYRALHEQKVEGYCRTMHAVSEDWTGRIRKRHKEVSRYYTARLLERLFIYDGTICKRSSIAKHHVPESGMERHVEELKRLIFSPGSPSDVPLIGKKTELFTDAMRPYYQFHIRSARYRDQIDAYVFEVRLKPEYQQSEEEQTVIKGLITYFSKQDFQVLGRTYDMAHNTLLYQFDVEMEIELMRQDGIYLPAQINYQGAWNIPFRRREDGRFSLKFSGLTDD